MFIPAFFRPEEVEASGSGRAGGCSTTYRIWDANFAPPEDWRAAGETADERLCEVRSGGSSRGSGRPAAVWGV